VPKQTERVIHKGRRWATAEQAAEYIHVHPLTIRRLIADGKLKGNKGAGWRILRVDLDELDALVSGDK
jgi:excisionase family DNA binding protein